MTDWRAEAWRAERDSMLDAVAYALAIMRGDWEAQEVILAHGDHGAIASQLATIAAWAACQADPCGDGEAWLVALRQRMTARDDT